MAGWEWSQNGVHRGPRLCLRRWRSRGRAQIHYCHGRASTRLRRQSTSLSGEASTRKKPVLPDGLCGRRLAEAVLMLFEEIRVERREVLPLRRDFLLWKDRVHRTLRYT